MARELPNLQLAGWARLAGEAGVQPWQAEPVVIAAADLQRAGFVRQVAVTARVLVATGPLAAAPYTGSLRLQPAPGWALRVLRAQAFVRDATVAAPPLWQAGRTLDNGVLSVRQGLLDGSDVLTAGGGANGVAVTDADIGSPSAVAPALDCTDVVAAVVASAARLTWSAPGGGLVCVAAGGAGQMGGGVLFAWQRTALAADEDLACLIVHATAAPAGCYPPT